MERLPKNYWQTNRFIDEEACEAPGCSEAETKVIVKWEHIERSYEGQKWYFIVFSPFNKPYIKDPEWFEHKAIDSARKWINKKATAYYITREIDATKIHSNILCVSPHDLLKKYHGKQCYNKYKMHVSELKDMGDRRRVLDYITKEQDKRTFKLYLDYYHSK